MLVNFYLFLFSAWARANSNSTGVSWGQPRLVLPHNCHSKTKEYSTECMCGPVKRVLWVAQKSKHWVCGRNGRGLWWSKERIFQVH